MSLLNESRVPLSTNAEGLWGDKTASFWVVRADQAMNLQKFLLPSGLIGLIEAPCPALTRTYLGPMGPIAVFGVGGVSVTGGSYQSHDGLPEAVWRECEKGLVAGAKTKVTR